MKKRYIHPEVQVFNVKAQNLLAGSLDVEVQNGGTLNAREFTDEWEFASEYTDGEFAPENTDELEF